MDFKIRMFIRDKWLVIQLIHEGNVISEDRVPLAEIIAGLGPGRG